MYYMYNSLSHKLEEFWKYLTLSEELGPPPQTNLVQK